MSRMKTLIGYALIIVAFYFFSNFASTTILNNSYSDLSSQTTTVTSEEGLVVETTEVKANRRQGIFTGTVTNTSNETIAVKYIRIRAYDDDILLQTRYLAVYNIEPNETRIFSTKFTADEINNYYVDFVDEVPEERTALDDALDNIKGIKVYLEKIPDWVWFSSLLITIYYAPVGYFIIF